MKVKFKTYLELEVEVHANVTPSCPPQPCSDPDHPAYSDPGDPGGAEIEAVFLIRPGKPNLDITDYLHDDEIKELETDAENEAMDNE